MKKYIFALALGAMTLSACNKEEEVTVPDENPQTITISAYGEPFTAIDSEGATKGTLNETGSFLWATGDVIGVRLYKGGTYNVTDSEYGPWDGPFTLSGGEGTTNGSFTYSGGGSLDWVNWGYAAFYPKYSNNVSNSDGKVYFELKKVYTSYVSGTCLMPMVANTSNEGATGRPSSMSFKHVGAGLRVTLKGVSASANQVSLTVEGKNIVNDENNGDWYGINPANAGTDYISAADGTSNTVYLQFATAGDKRDMTFIFPLPTVDLSGGITLKLYYNDGVDEHAEYWSRSAGTKNALPALTRGQVLDMPDIDVSIDPSAPVTLYFRAATPVTTKASLCSSVLGTADWPGTELTETETFAGSLWYKFETTTAKVWDKSVNFYFHGGGWASSETYGDFSTKHKNEYYFVAEDSKTVRQLSGRPADWSFTSSYGVNWNSVSDVAAGRSGSGNDAIQTLKATGSSSKVFVYFEVKKPRLISTAYDYANLLKMYLGDSESTTAFDWQWTSKYTKKFNSWLQKDGSPNLITYECSGYQSHVDQHTSLYVDADMDIVYYEMSIPRSFDACLQGTSATIAIEINQQYVEGEDWKGSTTQIGYAPTCWIPALSFTLPAYVAE